MKWRKLGKIFDPRSYNLFGNCKEYAQSPQTLELENRVRVYFSTREREKNKNMFLSKIAYVDFSKDFEKILGVSSHEVVTLGEMGTFDEHGIFPINLLKFENKIFGYTCGWSRRSSVPVETSTGLVISSNHGKTFERVGKGPVFTSSVKEPMLVGDSFVKTYNGLFHMWYIFGERWLKATDQEPPARVYKIGHAFSSNGVDWEREDGKTIIADYLNKDECQALPSVIKIEDRYHMYFCYREATDFRKNNARGYRLGYAYSDDLENWVRDEGSSGISKSPNGWDSEMMCYPHIFEVSKQVYLLYNGNEFGKYGFGLARLESE